MKIMTSFKNVKIGERFFYEGFEYIKTFNSENGSKKGAVRICSGAYMTDCEKWIVEVPIKSTKEKKTEQDSEIAIFTCDDDDPVIIRITKEQKRIIEILHDYDILCYDINVNFKSEPFVVDATKE